MGILLKFSKYTMVAARRLHLDRRIPDKASLDRKEALAKLQKTFLNNYFYEGREWPYKDVEKCVFVEQYFEDADGQLNDYKIFCFDSEPRLIQLDFSRLLSQGIPHVRTDFHIARGRIYFGEMTFNFGSGTEKITPAALDYEMGGWIDLDKVRTEK